MNEVAAIRGVLLLNIGPRFYQQVQTFTAVGKNVVNTITTSTRTAQASKYGSTSRSANGRTAISDFSFSTRQRYMAMLSVARVFRI